MAGEALTDFARLKLLMFKSENTPTDWKPLASTFLKAWASILDPSTLLDLGDLLVKVGFKNEAKEVLQVVLLLPTYAETLWGENHEELAGSMVRLAKEALHDLN